MKLDIFTNQWLDIVFEGRNKAYGAYVLRKSNNKTAVRALIFGAIVFAVAVSLPLILSWLPDSGDKDVTLDTKIVSIKLPPKKRKLKKTFRRHRHHHQKLIKLNLLNQWLQKRMKLQRNRPKRLN